jgi:hypothetical protein
MNGLLRLINFGGQFESLGKARRSQPARGVRAEFKKTLHEPTMRVLRPRSRIVSIRMSEEEFSTLRRICLTTGARSVSDLAREAMRGLLNGTSQETGDTTRNEYSAQMRELEQRVDKLSAEIEMFKSDRNL